MIVARGLATRLGGFQLQPVSLRVAAGEFMVLLGPSGAGKTVLLECLMGLKELESGEVIIDGRDVTRLPPEQRCIAYMPQDVALFPHLSVRDNILFGRRVRGTLCGADSDLDRLAELLHIHHLLSRLRIRMLSGGERQRVALARALIINPTVLFLDESFSAVDANIRRELLAQLRELQQVLGLTVVYVTHHQGEASVVGDRVAVLMAGRMVQTTTPAELFRRPADLSIAKFIQMANIFRVDRIDAETCVVRSVTMTIETHPPPRAKSSWLGIAAKDVLVLRPGESERLGLTTNCFGGRVSGIDRRHPRTRLRVSLTDDLIVDCEIGARDRIVPGRQLEPGDAVEIHLAPHALSLFPEEVS